jgi:CMP-N,N'-diacetyllegionaminic acid synthase
METVAIIIARGGSKGIPGKNLRTIGGISLVGWSVLHAKKSKLVNRVIINSDSDEILQEGAKYGAEVFKRPNELALDDVLDWPVFDHCLNQLETKENYSPDFVVHLRPTAPYREGDWIDQSIELLMNNPDFDSIRSVSEPTQHPYRVFTIDDNNQLQPIMKHEHPEPYLLRRQDLPKMYFYNCVIDVTKPETIKEKKSMTGSKILPFVMDPKDVIDIDTFEDFKIAETLFSDKIKNTLN